MIRAQIVGLVPHVTPRATYTTTGGAVSFRAPASTIPRWSAHVTFRVYAGLALVALNGDINGPFIELEPKESFDFPVATTALYIKGKTGDCEVAVVAALEPIGERGP